MEHNLSYKEAELYCRRMCRCEGADFDKSVGGLADYASACYRSALKAYKAVLQSMEEDGHSGLSNSITRGIVANLVVATANDSCVIILPESKNLVLKEKIGNSD